MKKYAQKILALTAVLTLCFLTPDHFGAYAETQGEQEKAGYQMVGFDDTQYRAWEENSFFKNMEEKTGVTFSFTQFDDLSKWTQQKNAYSSGGELPDVLFKACLTEDECIRLYEQGVLIDLSPYLESCCPNLSVILEEHPEYRKSISLPDGAIVSLPYINDIPSQNGLWINKTFLENVRKSVPTTMDELLDVLKAFRDQDANKNGNLSDEVPLAFLGSFDLKFLAHGFGLVANDYNFFIKNDQVCYMPLEEEFSDFVLWCADAYQEGLLDKNGFSTSDVLRQVTDEKATQTYGILIAPTISNVLPASWASDYQLLMPFLYEGEQIYRNFSGSLIRGTFAVTSACKDPETMLAWVDVLYGEEGSLLMNIGKENVDFVVDGDGTWRFTDEVSSNSYYTITGIITSGSACPGIAANDFQSMYSDSAVREVIEELKAFNAYCVEPFPSVRLSGERKERISALQNELGLYTDEQIARWVTGEEAFTEESYQNYKDTLSQKGLEEFLSLWQAVYDEVK